MVKELHPITFHAGGKNFSPKSQRNFRADIAKLPVSEKPHDLERKTEIVEPTDEELHVIEAEQSDPPEPVEPAGEPATSAAPEPEKPKPAPPTPRVPLAGGPTPKK